MGLLDRMDKNRATVQSTDKNSENVVSDEYREIRKKTHRQCVEIINKKSRELGQALEDRDSIREIITGVLDIEAPLLQTNDKKKIIEELTADICGFGPLEQLLADESISEIMVNGPQRIYVERAGKIELSNVSFRDEAHTLNVIDRIVSPLGRHIDEANPMVDARLPDGSRVNAIISPLSLVGPVITIRKFSKKPLEITDLVSFNSMNHKMAMFLQSCVEGKLNIIVSGGTGSGKTTLLNVLSGFIPSNERIVTIEDAAELQLKQQHVITLESRPANIEGKGQVSIRDLVRNALRMRPDRIVVGEVRGGETLDMLQAMNTGHDGSLTTAHANTSRDLLSRLETMVMMSGMELPLRAIREQVSSAIDVVVQQSRLRDGTRKITEICEVLGMEGDIIVTQPIFTYENLGGVDTNGKFNGVFRTAGLKPRCAEKIQANGVSVRDDWFEN